MSRNYKFHNPDGLYFVSFAVIEWLDVFTRNQYKDLLLESLTFSQKKMEVYSSTINYAGEKGLLDDIVVFRMFY